MTRREKVIEYLEAHGQAGAKEIAALLGTSSASASSILIKMEGYGDIERLPGKRGAPRQFQLHNYNTTMPYGVVDSLANQYIMGCM